MAKLKTLPGLTAADFMHPWDVKATAALKAVPGFDKLIAKVMEYSFERVYYLQNVADNVRVSDKMFPKLNRYLEWGCKILGVDKPELYVSLDPNYNAFTYGHTKPFIVITSSLLNLLDEQEKMFVICHELGHIKCEHVLYTLVAENIAILIEIFGKMTLGLGSLLGAGLALPLLDWYRKAELSADRAALLAVQDPAVAMRVFMKMAGGAESLLDDMDSSEFLRQIRAYEDRDVSGLDRAYKLLITVMRTHPFPIMRAKHLDRWIAEGGYTKVSGIRAEPLRI
ncbi:Zn-dependent protease with chaperone function [Enhygromyxa salina]|uniref:Zn-dependent protease with chaperone function n=1 Tax=Enhygromyxa salina TaxID=215803 RepID=A0A0C1ZXI0_9BACT|nr:M48 family metallopeptidase [Enhygromyxa salina]KIG15833.1 Zn-dependent protease with chaperone function [Enhygromyxa salina]